MFLIFKCPHCGKPIGTCGCQKTSLSQQAETRQVFRNSKKADHVRMTLDDIEVKRSAPHRPLPPRDKPSTYCCPTCAETCDIRNKRVIIGVRGERVGICKQCYKLGPYEIGLRLRKDRYD